MSLALQIDSSTLEKYLAEDLDAGQEPAIVAANNCSTWLSVFFCLDLGECRGRLSGKITARARFSETLAAEAEIQFRFCVRCTWFLFHTSLNSLSRVPTKMKLVVPHSAPFNRRLKRRRTSVKLEISSQIGVRN
ncbi:hypothetical protein CEXT_103741 [Caerostris extrusa]|uniref:Uncharacterized protein n=1 Tax=Caerostris extrusa TaxID=172846 RepID=A0AAV4QGS5_CAEEX|nr:hypothetical protein CEXT_103741 [Caerostris extrusa]